MHPSQLNMSSDQFNYIFYDEDPGIIPPDVGDISYSLDKSGGQPEYGWWEFSMDDVTAGRGKTMMSILDATDPDLKRFLTTNQGKLILYHGWNDTSPHPEPTLDYYKEVVKTTFDGDVEEARESFQLFMMPGMGHCGGAPVRMSGTSCRRSSSGSSRGRLPITSSRSTGRRTVGWTTSGRSVPIPRRPCTRVLPAGRTTPPTGWQVILFVGNPQALEILYAPGAREVSIWNLTTRVSRSCP